MFNLGFNLPVSRRWGGGRVVVIYPSKWFLEKIYLVWNNILSRWLLCIGVIVTKILFNNFHRTDEKRKHFILLHLHKRYYFYFWFWIKEIRKPVVVN